MAQIMESTLSQASVTQMPMKLMSHYGAV